MRARFWIVAAVGLLFLLGVLLHVGGVNGPSYWAWPWRSLGVWRTALWLAPGAALLAWALFLADRGKGIRIVLALAVAANLLLQLGGMAAEPGSFDRIRRIVVSEGATSYYNDALDIKAPRAWLANFHSTMLYFHSSTHPPGPVLFYYGWIRLLGPGAGAWAGGIALGVLASLGVIAMFAFSRLWTEAPGPRLTCSLLYASLPALTLFFPQFDQVYPLLTMMFIVSWVRAADAWRHGFLLGAIGFAASLFAYNLLTLGAFCAFHAAWLLFRRKGDRAVGIRLLQSVGTSLAVFLVLNVLASWATGYDPIGSFRRASAIQGLLSARMNRPYLSCVVFDLYDFLLGAGMVALPLIAFAVRRASIDRGHGAALTLLGLATVLTVDVTGLLRAETARVWIFLQPFLVVPAALEFARFAPRERWALMALQWAILVGLKASMEFIKP